jgi:hypothetical protein
MHDTILHSSSLPYSKDSSAMSVGSLTQDHIIYAIEVGGLWVATNKYS